MRHTGIAAAAILLSVALAGAAAGSITIDSTAAIDVSASGGDTAYLETDTIYVAPGGSLTVWGPGGLGGTVVTGGGDLSVPVILASFAADVAGSAVRLAWQTRTETDNLGFNVLRAAAEAGPYAAVNDKVIPGGGTSPQPRDYTFTDTGIAPGTVWYKLEMVDTRGTKTYSSPLSLEILSTGQVAMHATEFEGLTARVVSPARNIAVQLNVQEPSPMTVEVFSARGKKLAVLADGTVTAGTVLSYDKNISDGLYLVRLTSGGLVRSFKTIVSKGAAQ